MVAVVATVVASACGMHEGNMEVVPIQTCCHHAQSLRIGARGRHRTTAARIAARQQDGKASHRISRLVHSLLHFGLRAAMQERVPVGPQRSQGTQWCGHWWPQRRLVHLVLVVAPNHEVWMQTSYLGPVEGRHPHLGPGVHVGSRVSQQPESGLKYAETPRLTHWHSSKPFAQRAEHAP